jgi:hypothetical protein
MTKRTWMLIVLGAALLAGAAWLLQSRTARHAVGLAAEQGEIRLRDSLRPVRGTTRVLVLALDGVGDEALRAALGAGRMPHLAALLGAATGEHTYEFAYAAPDALSILPSTTWAAWSSVFTGEPAGATGVTGNEWFERDEMRFYAPGPVSVEGIEHTLAMYTDDLLGRRIRVPTLFERADVRAHVSLQGVHRGADVLTVPDPAVVGRLFGALSRGVAGEDPTDRAGYEALDRGAVDQVIATARAHGLPDLQVVYFPGVDLYTHLADHALDEKQRYLSEVLDVEIGRVLALYDENGALERTYVVIVSDHGHTPVLDDVRNALGESVGEPEGDGGAAVALLRQAGFRVRPARLDLGEQVPDFQAVVAYQGAMAYVYLADRSTCPRPGDVCDWRRPPRHAEDVIPVARAFHQADATGAGVPRLRQTLELVLARGDEPPGQPAQAMQAFDGERLVPVGEYLGRDPKPELFELESRLAALTSGRFGRHAGDVLLITRSGRHRPITDRFYFSSLYHSWHGSPAAHDSRIPFIVARRGASGDALRARVAAVIGAQPTQLDVTPLVLSLLGD